MLSNLEKRINLIKSEYKEQERSYPSWISNLETDLKKYQKLGSDKLKIEFLLRENNGLAIAIVTASLITPEQARHWLKADDVPLRSKLEVDSIQIHQRNIRGITLNKEIGGISDDLGDNCKILHGGWIAPKLYFLEYVEKKGDSIEITNLTFQRCLKFHP